MQARYDRYKDKDGKRQERTEWHNITCWVRLAEIASEYLRKGRAVYVESSPRTQSWDDKQSGQKRYQTYVSTADLVLLGGANAVKVSAAPRMRATSIRISPATSPSFKACRG